MARWFTYGHHFGPLVIYICIYIGGLRLIYYYSRAISGSINCSDFGYIMVPLTQNLNSVTYLC